MGTRKDSARVLENFPWPRIAVHRHGADIRRQISLLKEFLVRIPIGRRAEMASNVASALKVIISDSRTRQLRINTEVSGGGFIVACKVGRLQSPHYHSRIFHADIVVGIECVMMHNLERLTSANCGQHQ